MKKLLSLILTAVMLSATFLTVSAATNEVTVSNIAYSFEVTVKTEDTDRIILKIFPLTKESDGTFTKGNVPVHLGQANAPLTTTPINTYKINFSFLSTVATGWYRAETNKGNKDFYYVNPAGKVNFYKSLKAANESGIEAVISQGITDGVVDFDYGNYLSYNTAVKGHIGTAVNLLDGILPQDLEDAPTNEQINTYITSFENVFKPEFARLLSAAELVTSADAADFASEVSLRTTELGLDLTYYDSALLAIPKETVYNRFKVLTPADFSVDGINNMFDTAVLLAAIDTVEFGTLTEIIDYYDNDSNSTCITLDTSYLSGDAATRETQKNQISAKLKENAAAITTADILEDKYLDYSKPSTEGGSPSSPSTPPGPSTPGPAPAGPSGDTGNSGNEEPEQSGALSDLGEAEWAKESIEVLVEKGILAGKGDGKFYPNDTVTREEFIKIIAEAFEITDNSADAEFSDVDSNRWSYKYIASGYSAGIINGTTETEFDPAGKMTRQNMAVIIHRVAQYLGYDLGTKTAAFDDNADVSDYAKDAVGILAGAGIINGTGDNLFTPNGIVTRAQAAKIVYELLVQMGGIK